MNSINTILSSEKKIEKELEKSKQYWENKLESHKHELNSSLEEFKKEKNEILKNELHLEKKKINDKYSQKLKDAKKEIDKISFEKEINKLKEIINKEIVQE